MTTDSTSSTTTPITYSSTTVDTTDTTTSTLKPVTHSSTTETVTDSTSYKSTPEAHSSTTITTTDSTSSKSTPVTRSSTTLTTTDSTSSTTTPVTYSSTTVDTTDTTTSTLKPVTHSSTTVTTTNSTSSLSTPEMDKCLKKRLNGECNMPFETCAEGRCKCVENYAYSANETSCEPDFCKKSPCGKNMKCEEGDGTYICFCKEGYHQVGKDCVKYTSCSPGQSKCAQLCKGGGRCECLEGFSTTDNGETCDPVKEMKCNLNCGKGSCVVRKYAGGKSVESCACPEISHEYRNKTCIDKCTAGKLPPKECPVGVECLPDETLGYRCDCKGKYKFAPDGVHCERRLMCSEGGAENICASKNALCEEDFKNDDGYVCKCEDGYQKELESGVCKHKCELKQKECLQNQALCTLDVNNDAVCICPPLLTKENDGKCSKLAKYSIDYAKLQNDFDTAMNAVFEDYKESAILNCIDTDQHWKCSMEIKLEKFPGERVGLISSPTVCLPLSDGTHCMLPPNFVTKHTES
ncbi:fat-like cadherin-related tumor suppressor, partial [Nephila pilipes]